MDLRLYLEVGGRGGEGTTPAMDLFGEEGHEQGQGGGVVGKGGGGGL